MSNRLFIHSVIPLSVIYFLFLIGWEYTSYGNIVPINIIITRTSDFVTF